MHFLFLKHKQKSPNLRNLKIKTKYLKLTNLNNFIFNILKNLQQQF